MNTKDFAAIFDMDGVLVDTYDIMWGTHRKELQKYGIFLTDKDILKYVGTCAKDNVKAWNEEYKVNINPEEYCPRVWGIQAELFKTLTVKPSLMNFLEELHNNSVPKGVGTSAHKSRVEDILKNTSLINYLPLFVASEDVTHHKPHPEVYLKVANMLNMNPENCVVFEDARSGIQAAKAGNMKAVGVLNGHNTLEELSQADMIISDFSEIDYNRLYSLFNHIAAA
ncbi:MAG: HAD family hydrolase [Nanobdellota archaeon]